MPEQLTVEPMESSVEFHAEFRSQVGELERVLASLPGATYGDNPNCPLTHKFADGMYVREIFIPAGTLLTGKIHRHSHPNFLLQGEVSVITEEGGMERLKAPQSIISPAGVKRIVYAHTDTVWVTVHLNLDNEQDLDKIEEYVIAPSYEALEAEQRKAVETFKPLQLCPG